MISALFWSLWRRLYGEGRVKKYFSRTMQTALAIIILAYQISGGKLSPLSFFVAVWIVIEYWSRAIGEIIDAGLSHLQTKESYNRWFRIPLDYLYDKLEKKKYTGFYDFWYSLLRYGIGVLPLFYYSWKAVCLIPLQYPIYLGCHKLFMKYPNLYNKDILKKITLNEPKNVAEIIHGALFGMIVEGI